MLTYSAATSLLANILCGNSSSTSAHWQAWRFTLQVISSYVKKRQTHKKAWKLLKLLYFQHDCLSYQINSLNHFLCLFQQCRPNTTLPSRNEECIVLEFLLLKYFRQGYWKMPTLLWIDLKLNFDYVVSSKSACLFKIRYGFKTARATRLYILMSLIVSCFFWTA